VIAFQGLQVVQVAVVAAIGAVVGDHFGILPGSLEVVFLHLAAKAFLSQHRRRVDAVLGVRRSDCQHVAESIEGYLILNGVNELAGDLVASEGPANLARTNVGNDIFVGIDQVGLLVSEVEGALESESGRALLAIECGNELLAVNGQFRQHDRQVLVVRPIENAGRVREGQAIRSRYAAAGNERHLNLQARVDVAIEQQALLLLVGLVEDDETASGFEWFRSTCRGLDVFRQTSPLAEVASAVEVGKARRVIFQRSAFFVANDQVAMFLIEEGDVEKVEEATQQIEVLRLAILGYPAIAEALQKQADQVHLTVGAGILGDSPTETVFAHEIRKQLDVLFGVGAETWQLAFAQPGIRVKLESLAGEDECHHSVERVGSADAVSYVVEIAIGAGFVDAGKEAFDQATGFVLLGKSETEAADGLGDIEGLPVVVVVAPIEQQLVEALAGLVDETFPDGIALFGGAKGKQGQGGVGEAVLLRRVAKYLGGYAARGEVDEVLAIQFRFSCSPVEFADCEGGVAGLVEPRLFALDGRDRSILVDGIQIVAEHGASHVETLF